jgi:hypothetical protein
MGLLDAFRHRNAQPEGDLPKIEFGFRDEGVIYTLRGRRLEVSTTWTNCDRYAANQSRAVICLELGMLVDHTVDVDREDPLFTALLIDLEVTLLG